MSIEHKALAAAHFQATQMGCKIERVDLKDILTAYEAAKASEQPYISKDPTNQLIIEGMREVQKRFAEQPVDWASVIAELQANEKAAESNPILYRDGWECGIQCAMHIIRRHAADAPKRESGGFEYIRGFHAGMMKNSWQPIKTAPRDGTIILVSMKWATKPYQVRQASYGAQNSKKPNQWYIYFNRSDARYIDKEPDAWMPLPEPANHER